MMTTADTICIARDTYRTLLEDSAILRQVEDIVNRTRSQDEMAQKVTAIVGNLAVLRGNK